MFRVMIIRPNWLKGDKAITLPLSYSKLVPKPAKLRASSTPKSKLKMTRNVFSIFDPTT
jgi:hypothetical protein